MSHNETIVAQVTCPGKSAVGILRVSGSQAKTVAVELLGKIPKERFATYSRFLDETGHILDKGISLWFPSPNSFTGEDVLELQGHGSPVIIDLLIKRIISIHNVRIAKPGEFSERAFLNGKIDLIQAESIDDLINAETESSVRASLNSLQGDFSFHIKELMNVLIKLRINIESSIDFSEDIDINLQGSIDNTFKDLNYKFLKIKTIISDGSLLREGKKVVITGPPNAGKSSLFNALLCYDRSIVTNIPGTTRDLIYEKIVIGGIACELVDTAGLRDTKNTIENLGILRAWEIIKQSDHVLFVIDKTLSKIEQKKICNKFIKNISNHNITITFVFNKNDIVQEKVSMEKYGDFSCLNVSAHTGEGINRLRNHIMKIAMNKREESIFIARRRHIKQIDLAYNEFVSAKNNWIHWKNIELLADSLSVINKLLGEMIGEFTSNDLLERIFSNFCIGK